MTDLKDKFRAELESKKKLKPKLSLDTLRLARDFSKRHKVELTTLGGEFTETHRVGFISTGFQSIDDIISPRRKKGRPIPGSGKGLPRARMVEIYGANSTAKTALALAIVANAQKSGMRCGMIDAEQALSPDFASDILHVDADRLEYLKPKTGEEALRALQCMVDEDFDIALLDSVAAIVPEAELEGSQAMGQQARMMSQSCRKITALLHRSKTLVIFINQTRQKIGVMFGNPEVTSGGLALSFYASVRIKLKKLKTLTRMENGKTTPYGDRIEAKVTKNKVGIPHGVVIFDILYDRGLRIPKLHDKKAIKKEVSHDDDE